MGVAAPLDVFSEILSILAVFEKAGIKTREGRILGPLDLYPFSSAFSVVANTGIVTNVWQYSIPANQDMIVTWIGGEIPLVGGALGTVDNVDASSAAGAGNQPALQWLVDKQANSQPFAGLPLLNRPCIFIFRSGSIPTLQIKLSSGNLVNIEVRGFLLRSGIASKLNQTQLINVQNFMSGQGSTGGGSTSAIAGGTF